jgi:hypothetical protein
MGGIYSYTPWILAHSVYNHFFLAPIINTMVILASLPLLLIIVFKQSERSVSDWLGAGFDANTVLLELLNSGKFSTSKVGMFLNSLKEKFEGAVVV